MLGLIVVLMITFIIVQLNIFNFFEDKNLTEQNIAIHYDGIEPRQEAEAAMYDHLHDQREDLPIVSNLKSSKNTRNYYNNRAYAGAPPRIPHTVNDLFSKDNGNFESCLHCHQNGSYSIEMKAYAPIVPHPNFLNCKQCHVPQKTEKLFKSTDWKNTFQVVRAQRHLPGSPPVIPHSLQLRENCLSCHLGNSAMEEIKVTHPERTNCRQCHVETNSMELFSRKTIEKNL